MKLSVLPSLVALFAVLGLSACGDSTDSASKTAEQKNTMEVKTPPATGAPSLQQAIVAEPQAEVKTEVETATVKATPEVVTAPAPSGEQAYASCAGCHGVNGGGGVGPALKGKTADDLVAKLKAYRSGEQVGPMTLMMAPMAMSLTDEDIDLLVSYIVTF